MRLSLSCASSLSTSSLANLHGDTLATVDATQALTSTFTYDPYGNLLSSTNPANTANNASFGWEGQHQKTTEIAFTLTPIQMGARVYIPSLGRFLQADPVPGGTPNDYVYPPDPVNGSDLNGMWWSWGDIGWLARYDASHMMKIYHVVCGDGWWQLSCVPLGGLFGLAGKWGIRAARVAWIARLARDARIAEIAARIVRTSQIGFKLDHARRHLVDIKLGADLVENAIRHDLAGRSLKVGQWMERDIHVRGVTVTYRAYRVTKNYVSVGTYFLPK